MKIEVWHGLQSESMSQKEKKDVTVSRDKGGDLVRELLPQRELGTHSSFQSVDLLVYSKETRNLGFYEYFLLKAGCFRQKPWLPPE